MSTKTKTELEAEIKTLKQQLERKSQVEQYDKCANQIHDMYTSFVDAGFTEEQAWELIINIIKNNPTRTF